MYMKKGFPKKNDIVLATVTRVITHSVFVKLEEYSNLEGMIHTSEMDRRSVRNMKTFFKIGRSVVCKVMDVDEEKNQINLSIKRVGASQERTIEKEWKNEKKADDIITVFAKMNKLKSEEVYAGFAKSILDKYGLIYPAFEEIARGNLDLLEGLKLKSGMKDKIIKLIKERITIPKARVAASVELSTSEPNGVDIIKKSFELAAEYAKKHKILFNVLYSGAPIYQIKIETEDRKGLEKEFEKILEIIKTNMIKHNGNFVKKNEVYN